MVNGAEAAAECLRVRDRPRDDARDCDLWSRRRRSRAFGCVVGGAAGQSHDGRYDCGGERDERSENDGSIAHDETPWFPLLDAAGPDGSTARCAIYVFCMRFGYGSRGGAPEHLQAGRKLSLSR